MTTLKRLLDRKGFSGNALAKASDVPQPTVSRIVNGAVPTIEVAQKLVGALQRSQVTPEEIKQVTDSWASVDAEKMQRWSQVFGYSGDV